MKSLSTTSLHGSGPTYPGLSMAEVGIHLKNTRRVGEAEFPIGIGTLAPVNPIFSRNMGHWDQPDRLLFQGEDYRLKYQKILHNIRGTKQPQFYMLLQRDIRADPGRGIVNTIPQHL